MRKLLLLGLTGVLGLLSLAYVTVVLFPLPRHQKEVQDGLTSAQTAFSESQAQLGDPAKNGWKNSTFLPYWGRKGSEYVDGSPISQTVETWRNQTTAWKEQTVDYGQRLKAKDPAFDQALANFEKVAPQLLEAFHKPVFGAPMPQGLTLDTLVPNLIGVRTGSQGLAGLAGVRMAQGRPEEALQIFEAIANQASNLDQNAGLIHQMIAAAIRATAFEALVGYVDPRGPTPASAWKSLSISLTRHLPASDLALRLVSTELLATHNSFELWKGNLNLARHSLSGVAGTLSLRLPAMLAREQRIYHNVMGELLAQLQAGQPLVYPQAFLTPDAMDILSGKAGLLTPQLLPNFENIPRMLDFHRRRMVGSAVMAGVAAYLGQTGSLPSTLEQARETAEMPSAELLSELGVTYQVQNQRGIIKLPIPLRYSGNQNGYEKYGPRPWFQQDETGLTFTI